MLTEKRSTRFGAALIIFAVLVRLLSSLTGSAVRAIRQPEETTGTIIRETAGPLQSRPQTQVTVPPTQTDPPETQPTVPEPEPLLFSAADLSHIRVQYASDCSHRPNLEKLLLRKLNWDLTGDEPTVLILHTHASESYTPQPGQNYQESADYRTLNEGYNMVAVGDYLTKLLENAGISVLHDRSIHDYPSYTQAYTNSRDAVRAYLQQYPTIQVVLDLHRDAAENPDGSQYATSCTANGQKVAQLMLVVGTNASGNYHPNWQENLAAAVKLQVLLEQMAPGITRQTILRAQRFNHDLSAGAMIVEVGTAGNTLDEAMGAIPYLAEALISLMHGAAS